MFVVGTSLKVAVAAPAREIELPPASATLPRLDAPSALMLLKSPVIGPIATASRHKNERGSLIPMDRNSLCFIGSPDLVSRNERCFHPAGSKQIRVWFLNVVNSRVRITDEECRGSSSSCLQPEALLSQVLQPDKYCARVMCPEISWPQSLFSSMKLREQRP